MKLNEMVSSLERLYITEAANHGNDEANNVSRRKRKTPRSKMSYKNLNEDTGYNGGATVTLKDFFKVLDNFDINLKLGEDLTLEFLNKKEQPILDYWDDNWDLWHDEILKNDENLNSITYYYSFIDSDNFYIVIEQRDVDEILAKYSK